MNDDKQEGMAEGLLAAVREEDGRKYLKCAEAWRLAGKFGVELIEIGRLCDQHDIRITSCQLGLFR